MPIERLQHLAVPDAGPDVARIERRRAREMRQRFGHAAERRQQDTEIVMRRNERGVGGNRMPEMRDRRLALAPVAACDGKVVVRLGEAGMEGDRRFERRDRVGRAAEQGEHGAEIVLRFRRRRVLA